MSNNLTIVDRLLDKVKETANRIWNDPDTQDFFNKKVRILDTLKPADILRHLDYNSVSSAEFINTIVTDERIIGRNDLFPVNYLSTGVHAAKSVCRICIIDENRFSQGCGTGFMIAPNILLTNNHVLPEKSLCKNSLAEFDYELDTKGKPKNSTFFSLDGDILFYTNKALDYTIVYVRENTDGAEKLSDFGILPLNPMIGKINKGDAVSIIQHPNGAWKSIAVRNNEVVDTSEPDFILYSTDTDPGSSGSPVFNDNWEVVALHHSGKPRVDDQGRILNKNSKPWNSSQGEGAIDWIANEGVRISAIINDIAINAKPKFSDLLQIFMAISDPNVIKVVSGADVSEENTGYYDKRADVADKKTYYNVLGSTAVPSFDDLNTLLNRSHTKPQNYSPSKLLYPTIDLHPDGMIRSIYSGKKYSPNELVLLDKKVDIDRELRFLELSQKEASMSREAFLEQVDFIEQSLPYNCEHVMPQSWFGKQEPMRGDLHHLFACESGCNSFRSNHPYADIPNYSPKPIDETEKERPLCGNMEQGRFEPENNKGIVARAVLYFLVRHPRKTNVYTYNDLATLLAWSKSQPITLYEKHRNREIFLVQGNRNPFIDFYEWIDRFDFTKALK